MLTRAGGEAGAGAEIAIREAGFPNPFKAGLEYSAPARGVWNIVHTGMLLPEAQQIFVCAAGCLRGVVLTAAEMGAAQRFSTIEIQEHNLLDGDMEELILDGVADILARLPKRPPAVLLFTSCIHHFVACDLPRVYRELARRFPDIAFADCYMNPIMRKSGLTPDQLMRRQLYSLLTPRPLVADSVNIIGNDLPTDDSADFVQLLNHSGQRLLDITRMHSYGEYQSLAASWLNIVTYPAAQAAGQALAERLGQRYLYLPQSFDPAEIESQLLALAAALGQQPPDCRAGRQRALAALSAARGVIGHTPILIDYTASPRPLGLAKLLLEQGFRVEAVYLDGIAGEEKDAFAWLQGQAPELKLRPTVSPLMRVTERAGGNERLCIGQKAAYFSGSDHFVNIVEGGGLHGFDGVARLAALLTDAYQNEKDARSLIQIKGLGCGCCA